MGNGATAGGSDGSVEGSEGMTRTLTSAGCCCGVACAIGEVWGRLKEVEQVAFFARKQDNSAALMICHRYRIGGGGERALVPAPPPPPSIHFLICWSVIIIERQECTTVFNSYASYLKGGWVQ